MPDALPANQNTQTVPDGGMRFGSDLVLSPATPAVGPTDPLNSAYTIKTGYFGSQPTSSVVTSSNSAQNSINNTQTSVGNLPPTVTPPPASSSTGAPPTTYTWSDGTAGHLTPDVNGFGTIGYNATTDPNVAASVTSGNQIYTNQETALQQQRDQEIANLTTQENNDVSALTTTQANETGGSTRNLLAMGGYLGNNSFANSYLNTLQTSHEQAMQTLQAKYTSAIQAAQNAYTNNDFALAEKMVANASSIQKAAQDRNTQFLDQTDKIQTEARAAATQAYDVAKSARDYATTQGITQPFYELGGQLFSTSDGSMITSADQYTQMGGKPDYSNVYVVPPNNKQYAGGDLGEFQYLVDQGQYKPGQLQQFLNQKKQDAMQIAAAGRSITVAQQQFALTQQQTTDLQNLSQFWHDNKYVQGNGTIDSKTYKTAKQQFVGKYGADAGPAFDKAMMVYVDSSNKDTYANDYGLN